MGALTSVLYHAVSPLESDFERGLGVITHPEKFEQHIRYFEKNYDIVDLDTILRGKLPRRPLLITFDDFYKSVLTVAREVLKPRNIPSLFFVNPALLGADTIGLDNLLAFSVNRFGLQAVCETMKIPVQSVQSLDDLLEKIASTKSSAERAQMRSTLLAAFGPAPDDKRTRCPIADPQELLECAELGIEVGNHTSTHVHGRGLKPEELQSEIVKSRQQLAAMCGTDIRAFSVPYGSESDLTEPLLKTLRESGHKATFLVHARSNLLRKAPDIWYRTSLHNEAVSELPRKLTTLPLLRSARHWLFR